MALELDPVTTGIGALPDQDATAADGFARALDEVQANEQPVQQAQLLLPMPAAPGAPPVFGGTPDDAAVDGLARSIQHGMDSTVEGVGNVVHDGVEQWRALEYCGPTRCHCSAVPTQRSGRG